jgi:hypothetical protein
MGSLKIANVVQPVAKGVKITSPGPAGTSKDPREEPDRGIDSTKRDHQQETK